MNEDKRASFTAASVFPLKLLQDNKTIQRIKFTGKIPIRHIQLNPTNVCPFSCPFCSCANRAKTEHLTYEDIKEIVSKAYNCGLEAITITGGGEPLSYPQINETINYIRSLRIEVGLVTNAFLIKNLKKKQANKLTWCRISSSDYLENEVKKLNMTLETWLENIENKIREAPKVGWAFSYVLSKNPNYEILKRLITFANEHKFTHVRIVSDLLESGEVPMYKVKLAFEEAKIDDKLVIYQDRKQFKQGTKNCWISILKPVITPQGTIQPCCGVQYRTVSPSLDYDKAADMCGAKDIDKLYETQRCFDGSKCFRCYYSEYNELLELFKKKIEHEAFL